MLIEEFQVGDVLECTSRSNLGEEKRTAIVTNVNIALNLVAIMGYHVDERLETGQGAFDPSRVGAKRFGFYVAVRKIGRGKVPGSGPHWYPKPGNPGYDLMC